MRKPAGAKMAGVLKKASARKAAPKKVAKLADDLVWTEEQKRGFVYFVLICVAMIVIEAVHLVHRVVNPVEAPEIAFSVVGSNTAPEGTGEVRYPTLEEDRFEMATYYDKFCVDVTANPAGTYLHDFSLLIEKTYDHQKFFGGTEKRTITIYDSKEEYRGYENAKNPYCFEMKESGVATYKVTAKNSGGESLKSFSVGWIEDCSTMGTIRDGENKWTKCDENSSYNEPILHPGRYDANGHLKEEYGGAPSYTTSGGGSGSGGANSGGSSSGGSGASGGSSASGSGSSSTKPTANSTGLTSTTAENVCAKRLQRSYELDDILDSSLSGDTWEVELTGLHEGSTHDSMIYVECHVTGSNSNPRITYYNEDVYKDYYINDDGYYEDCYYGYDYATGQCR